MAAATRETGTTPTTKVSYNLPLEDQQILKDLAERRRTTVTHVLRQAIASEKFLDDQIRSGAKVLIEKDDKLREVVFKF